MDWLTIVIIVLAIVGLIVLYWLTDTGAAKNCLDRHKASKRKHFKDWTEQEDAGK